MDGPWRSGPQKWPPRSPDLSPLDFHVWSYIKNMVYELKVYIRNEPIRWIFYVARRVNDAAVTVSLHFPQFKESGSVLAAISNIY